jgi:hypothetical protein
MLSDLSIFDLVRVLEKLDRAAVLRIFEMSERIRNQETMEVVDHTAVRIRLRIAETSHLYGGATANTLVESFD